MIGKTIANLFGRENGLAAGEVVRLFGEGSPEYVLETDGRTILTATTLKFNPLTGELLRNKEFMGVRYTQTQEGVNCRPYVDLDERQLNEARGALAA